jgi:hypothetical protein
MSGKTSHSTTLSYYNTLKLHIVHALPLVIATPLLLQVVTLSLIGTTTVIPQAFSLIVITAVRFQRTVTMSTVTASFYQLGELQWSTMCATQLLKMKKKKSEERVM